MDSQQPMFSPQPPKPAYSPVDTAFAWLSLLFAFLFCQAVPVTSHPLGSFLLILAMFASGFVILRLKKAKLRPVCILSALSSLVIGSALLLTNTAFLINLSMIYCLGSFCYFLYAALGNRIEEGFSDYIYIDFIKILFILPFRSFVAIFPAIFNKSSGRGALLPIKILAGVLIAIIPTSLVFLFLSYDSGFMKILDDLFSFTFADFAHTLASLYFTLPLAMYGFGLYASADKKRLNDKITADSCRKVLQKTKILPQLTALVAVLPIVFLYVVFFISQWKYYISGFTGVLPEGFSYAEYARQGFFELCAVSVINLVLIAAMAFFIKRGKNGGSVIMKLVAAVFCICTLILISTAVAKLVMYINSYGLTQKRIYAMWLMALIAIIFPIIAISQFLRKRKTVALCLTVAIVMFAGLSVCNVNALCARYNADRYLSGTLETLDVEAMDELGDSAIPSLVRVASSPNMKKDTKLKQAIDGILFDKLVELREEKFSVFAFNLPSALAKAALKDYVPAVPPAGSYVIDSLWVDHYNDSWGSEKEKNTLIIRPDKSGTITYEGETSGFQITGTTVTIRDITFEITCEWTSEYTLDSMEWRSVDADDTYRITLSRANAGE